MLRTLAMLSLMLVAAFSSNASEAQTYPVRPIRLAVPFPPGGVADVMARLLAQEVSKNLGQSVIVENRPGGGGTIAVDAVAKAPPDGYFIVLAASGGLAINVSLMKLPYDPVTDLAPISLIGTVPFVVVAHPGAGIESIKDLISKAKARPGVLAFGSVGNGTPPHLAGELFKMMTRTDLAHVPYKGSGPALTDVIAGQIPIAFVDVTAGLAHIRSGKVRGLATTGAQRSVIAPDVPTMSEAGLAGYDLVGWLGLVAPARTPVEIVQKLSTEANRVMKLPEVRERSLAVGVEPMAGTPEQFSAFIVTEIPKWARIVQASGAKLD